MAAKSAEDKELKEDVEKKSVDTKKDARVEMSQIFDAIFKAYEIPATDELKNVAHELISKALKQIVNEHACAKKYNVLVLYDAQTMVKGDADNIYNAITSFTDTDKKPLLLILYSNGGVIGSAYLIGKLCREYSCGSFTVAVPRHAKSAATLVCCAADEIHMGSLSELGPIDPQIKQMPALGLKNSIEHIAQLVKETPESSDMFAKYLHLSLKLIDLGYYERIAESAEQYATILLETHRDKLPDKPESIAHKLVYAYKDHGFVIDKSEALRIFGEKVAKMNTAEYSLANALYKTLNMIEWAARRLSYNFYFIGSLDAEPNFVKRVE